MEEPKETSCYDSHGETRGNVDEIWSVRTGNLLTCNENEGSTQFVADTNACEMTWPPYTPRARIGNHNDLERYRFTSSCSTSKEVEMCSCSVSLLLNSAIVSIE